MSRDWSAADLASAFSAGERIRIAEAIGRLRMTIASVELSLQQPDGPSHDVVQAIAHSGSDLAVSLARLHAYLRVERESIALAEVSRG